jgi:hypothetical protein
MPVSSASLGTSGGGAPAGIRLAAHRIEELADNAVHEPRERLVRSRRKRLSRQSAS